MTGLDPARRAIRDVANEVGARLGLPPVDPVVVGFLECLGADDTGDAVIDTAVSSTGLPAEFSLTGRAGTAATLRLLSEPLEPGGGAVGRCALGLRALGMLLERTGVYGDPERAVRAAARAFPSGGEVTTLQWNAPLWLGLRTDGRQTGVRVYVNVHNRPIGDRYSRLTGALNDLGLSADAEALPDLVAVIGGWATPIGFSLDFARGASRTARVHFNVASLSYRRLSLLVSRVAPRNIRGLMDFLAGFRLVPGGPAPSLLLSVGLEDGAVTSVKCDVTVRGPEGPLPRRPRLDGLEQRFGAVPGREATGDIFADPELLRYVGLTLGQAHEPYLNVYYSAPHLPRPRAAGGHVTVSTRTAEARCVRGGGSSRGSVAGSTSPWAEVCDALVRGLLRMATGELVETTPRPSVVVPVRAGGYAWRSTGDGAADPTATWCGVCGIVPGAMGGPDPATVAYLRDWVDTQDAPACLAGCRSLLPIYLAAGSRVLERLGPGAAALLRAEVNRRRRTDGTWGSTGPEVLDTALAVLALDRLGGRAQLRGTEATVAGALAARRLGDGGWCWAPLVCDGAGTWFGARAVTTALVGTALDLLGRTAVGLGEIPLVR